MRTYTISQAKRLMPLLQRELGKLKPAYCELRTRWLEVAESNGLSVEDPRVRDVCLLDDGARQAIEQVEMSLSLFDDLGVECKGIEEGIFDFPCLVEDRLVFLCWQVGENDIAHWHEVDTGFGTRKPLCDLNPVSHGHREMLLN